MKKHPQLAALVAVWLATATWAQSAPATAPEKPIPKECREMADELVEIANARDVAGFDRLVNVRRIAERATEGITAPPAFKKGFETGVGKSGFGTNLMPTFEKQQAKYKLLKIGWQDGEIIARYRMYGAGGVNYHEWTCERQPDGTWCMADGYFGTTGEKCSETFRRLYIQGLAAQFPGMIGKIRGVDKKFMTDINAMSEMSTLYRSGKIEEALRVYDTLSPEFAKSKLSMIIWISALQSIRAARPGQFKDACAEYQKLFPGDPSTDLICLDSFMSDKNYAACYASLDRLENRFHDVFLKTIRAEVLKQEQKPGNLEKAEVLLTEVTTEEPTLLAIWDRLIQVRTKLKKNAQAVEALKEYENVSHMKLGPVMEGMPEYADFVATDEYKAYKAATYK